MNTPGFAAAAGPLLEPPDEQHGTCTCGHSEEDHYFNRDYSGCDLDKCYCYHYVEQDPDEARDDAESEAGDTARKERDHG